MTYNKDQIVCIRKGSQIKSLHPKGDYILTRNQKVKVHLFLEGYTYDGEVHPSRVSWAGTGGYWCYADVKDIVV